MAQEQESGIWKPEDIQPDYNGNNVISWRGTRAMVVGLFWGHRLPQPKVHQSFVDLLDPDLLIYFLNYLTSSSQMDTFRRLLHADTKLKKLVVNILDNIDPWFYMRDVDPLLIKDVSRITLKDFHKLDPTDDLKMRPIRIFTIRDCGIGFLPACLSVPQHSQILPYLTKNTPMIIKTFGEDSLSAKRVKKWSESLPIKFPLILIQDYTWNYKMMDLGTVNGDKSPNYIEPPYYLNVKKPLGPLRLYDRRSPYRLAMMLKRELSINCLVLEVQNIPDYGHLKTPAERLEEDFLEDIISLHFKGQCTSIDEESCCSPRLELPLRTTHGTKQKFSKLAVSFDGPRFPSVKLIYNLTNAYENISPAPVVIELVNNNWSESNPFGNTCQHARDEGKDASQWCVDPNYVTPITIEPRDREKMRNVVYVGLPDDATRLIDLDRVRAFTWRRMSPTKLPLGKVTISAKSLKRLYLFTLVRNNELLPVFQCEDLKRLTLVALENSTGGFDLKSLLNGIKLPNLETLTVLGPQLGINCPDLSIVSDSVVQVIIRGYISQFVTDTSCDLVFHSLERLTIDISQIPTVSPTLSLEFKEERFPKLELIVLGCAWRSSWRFDMDGVDFNLELPDTCCQVQISTAAQIKNMAINGVRCPFTRLRKYIDTYSIWSKEDDGLFSYSGLDDCSLYFDAYSE